MKRIISISLSLLLLLGNLGLTYGTHFCGGHAVVSEVMLGQEHMDCGMAMMEMPKSQPDNSISAPECCTNEYVAPDTDEAVKHNLSGDFTPALVTLATAFELFEVTWDEVTFPKLIEGPPLLPGRDYHALYQVFII